MAFHRHSRIPSGDVSRKTHLGCFVICNTRIHCPKKELHNKLTAFALDFSLPTESYIQSQGKSQESVTLHSAFSYAD